MDVTGGHLRPEDYRQLPTTKEERERRNATIWEQANKAIHDGDTTGLFDPAIVGLGLDQLETPVDTSWHADPVAAARIRDGLSQVKGLLPRWERALRDLKAERHARAKRLKAEFSSAAAYNPKPIEFDDSEGETAVEWGRTAIDNDFTEMLSRMNAEHAVVPFSGGAVRYLHHTTDLRGNQELRFLRPDDFHRLYAHVRFSLGGRQVTASQAWERWAFRKQYAGVGMFPGSEKHEARVPSGYLNLWKGFATQPKEGKWGKFRKHLYEKVCQSNDEYFTWLMDWLAHIAQKPQEKPGTCVVLKSAAEGTGKSMLAVFLQRMFGEHVCSVSKAEQIVGRFNGHLLKNLVLVCEEAFWAGSKDAEGALKNLITESELTIEQKGLDAYSAPNYSRLLMISNNDWVVPVGADPRRYFVLEVVNEHANDRNYFDPIWKQMNSGGTEAMLYDLMNWDISEADLRSPPVTDGLREQRAQSLSSTERWLLDVAEAGGVRDYKNECRVPLREMETGISTDLVKDAATKATGPSEHRNLARTLGQMLKRVGVRRIRLRKKGGALEYLYEFPPLPEFRSAVMELLQVRLDDHERAGPTIH
jgi:hypothetical protein